MATTFLTSASERAGQTVLTALVSNIDSGVALNENFRLPVGFGDCFITGISLIELSLQTIVANSTMRGPSVFLQSTVLTDFVGDMPEWRRLDATSVGSAHDVDRPVLWKESEVLNVEAASEDTGVGDTGDLTILVRVARLRNQTPSVQNRFIYAQP